jgi:hypothetical protein
MKSTSKTWTLHLVLFVSSAAVAVQDSADSSVKAPLDAHELWNFARDHKLDQRMEDLLKPLVDTMGFQAVYAYKSRSAQGASFQNPRVILRNGPTNKRAAAEFIVTFNGDPTHRGYNSLEVMQYNRSNHEFELYELKFPLSNVSPQMNPPKCLACHGQDPRPNWDSYPIWPGFYGSEEDRLGSAEIEAWKAFTAKSGLHPRYRVLNVQNGYFPSGELTKFGVELDRLNGHKVATELFAPETWTRLKPYRFAMLAAYHCLNIDQFIPAERREGFVPFAQSAAEMLQRQRSDLAQKAKAKEASGEPMLLDGRMMKILKTPGASPDGIDWDGMRYLLENLNIPVNQWSLVFGRSSYMLNTGFRDALGAVKLRLWSELERSTHPTDLKIASFNRSNYFFENQWMMENDQSAQPEIAAFCRELKTASLAELSKD